MEVNTKQATTKKWAWVIVLSAVICSIFMHWNIFNKDITGTHTWRQSQTQLNIRGFYRQDANILNTRVAHYNGGKDNLYRYEFPLMQWSIAMLQHVFGEDIIVTRISIFIIGLLGLCAFHALLLTLFRDPIIAALGFWSLSFSPVFYYYTVNPLPDNLALSAGLCYLYFAVKCYKAPKISYHLAAALFLSIATLAKLPYILLGAVSFFYFLQIFKANRYRISLGLLISASGYVVFMIPAFLWYRWVMPGWEGNGILHGIFGGNNDIMVMLNILYYHLTVMFPRILLNPVALFFLAISIWQFILKKHYLKKEAIGLLAALLLVTVYFLLEINMISINHDYYMMPFLPFLFLASMYGANWAWYKNLYTKYLSVLIFLAMPILCHLQNKNSWTPEMSGYNIDLFKYQKELQKAIPQKEQCIVLNDHTYFGFLYLIDKQGHVFANDYLPLPWVEDMVHNKNVRYMYSDSRKFDENPEFQQMVDTVLLQVGSIKVMRLK